MTIFAPVRRLVSIWLIILFGSVGASSILHQLEQSESHTHKDGTHICVGDAHHHCSLCDTIISSGLISKNILDHTDIVWHSNYAAVDTVALYTHDVSVRFGRAPPMNV